MAPCPLFRTMEKIKTINDVYESHYIHKSLIVCGFSDLETMYHMNHIMKSLDYPVDVLTVRRSPEVLKRFCAHSLRTLIVGELFGALLETHLSFVASHIDTVFVDRESVKDPSWIHRTFNNDQKIIYL